MRVALARGGRFRVFTSLAVLNALNALLAVISSVLIAHFFGTGRGVEIYFAALGIHATVASLAQTGQVSEVLLPAYHSVRDARGQEVAYHAYAAQLNRVLIALAIPLLIGWLFAMTLSELRVPGFRLEDVAIVAEMLRWSLPLVLIQVASELLRTLANAERLYGRPELATAVARVTAITALVLLAARADIWALMIALWCSAVVEVCGLVLVLYRRGFRYRLAVRMPDGVASTRLGRKLISTVPYVGATQLYSFVLDAAVSHLAQGSFAVFKYATLIWSRTAGIFLRPVSVPFFTAFSEGTARNSESVETLIQRALSQVLAVAAVVTAAVIGGAGPVLTAILGGERFPPSQMTELVWLLGGLYIMLPIAGMAIILRKVTVSIGLIRETYTALAVLQIVTATAAWLLVPWLGLVGVLLVSILNNLGAYVAHVLVLRRAGSALHVEYPFGTSWRWLLSAAFGVLLALSLQGLVLPHSAEVESARLAMAAIGLGASAVAVAVTLGAALILRVPESIALLSLFARRRSR